MSTFVLVHGAWHGGWCWREVRRLLEDEGHHTIAPTLSSGDVRRFSANHEITLDQLVDDATMVVNSVDEPNIVLVGHSFGGPVISGVAERARVPISQLVYLDAAILENGESMFSRLPPEVVSERIVQAERRENAGFMPLPSAAGLGVDDKEIWASLASSLTPQPLSTYLSEMELERMPGEGFQCVYIQAIKPAYAPLEWARERARDYGWPMLSIETGHEAMITAPKVLARLLVSLAACAQPSC